MKQVILNAKIVTKVNENAETPVTIGVGVSDDTVVSVGQILEDDFTVRDITEQEIIDTFGLQTSVNKRILYAALTKEEITSFVSASKSSIEVEVIKGILDSGGSIDLIEDDTLVKENIITVKRIEDILGITEKKEFIAMGMDLNLWNKSKEVQDVVVSEEAAISDIPVTE